MKFFGAVRRARNKLNEYMGGGYIPKPFDKTPKIVLLGDMAVCRLAYGININDYFAYRFYMLNHRGRKSFLTSNRDYFYFFRKINNLAYYDRFENKAEFTKYYGEYMGRSQYSIDQLSTEETYVKWIDEQIEQGTERFIFKKTNGARGADIYTVEVGTSELYDYTKIRESGTDYVVEPVLENHPVLQKLHPASLNTIRIPVVIVNSEPVIMGAYLRIGNNYEAVDNFSHGGIVSEIDVETGVTFTRGVDKHGKEFLYHPLTGEQLVGIHIPFWQETLKLVKTLAMVTPEVVYSSWDIAITQDKPVVIEGNYSGDVDLQQIPQHMGKRWLFDEVLS